MSDYFLLRGRRPLLREAAAAWISLTGGALLFGIIMARFTPSIGRDAALAASLVLVTPVSAILLQAVRTGRLTIPRLSGVPVGRPRSETKDDVDFRDLAAYWRSLAPEEKEGLRFVAGMMGATLISPPTIGARSLTMHIQLDDGKSIHINEEMLMKSPEEFTVPIKGDGRMVLVKIDREKRLIHLTPLPEEKPPVKG